MVEKIAVQIALDGGEVARKQLEALGKAGEQAFKQIADAAKKPITDSAQIDRAKQAMNELATAATKLGPQFQTLAASAKQFGTEGAQASQQVTDGLNQTSAAAQQAGTSIQKAAEQSKAAGETAATRLISAATTFKIAAVGIVAAITAVTNALTKGAVETGTALNTQAEKLGLTIKQWLELRQAIGGSTISADDFAKGVSKIPDLMEKAKGSIVRLGNTTTRFFTMADGSLVKVIASSSRGLQTEGEKAAEALAKMGINAEAIFKGDVLSGMRDAATAINKIPDATKRAAAGMAVFGKNWEQIVQALVAGKVAAADAGKAFRDLSATDVDKTVKLKAAWEDLSAAIRAVRDRIGALFLDPALARAEWLVKLVDGAHQLFIEWSKLSGLKQELFVAGLGTSPAETTFKILITVGNQLAGIWRDILVPAGNQLLAIFAGISASIGGITNNQVAAFFITAAIAAAGLAIALKGIGLVLTPLATLFSLAFSPLGIILIAAAAAAAVFWDQLKAGADSVLATLPEQVAQVQQALQLLFTGDFAGAWAVFSQAAIEAFQTIKQSILQSEGVLGNFLRGLTGGEVQIPWVKTLTDGIRQIGQDLPATLLLIVNGFIALGNAATTAANIINKIFGTQLTGTDVAAILILAQLTGGLQAMASMATVAAAGLGVLIGVLGLLVTAVGGLPVAIGLLVAALGALIAFNWDSIKSAAVATFDAITGAIGRAYNTLLQWLGLRAQAGGTPLAGGSSIGSGGIGSKAGGGLLGGRGSGRSDSNLAWVSRGEHIMPARVVRQPGVLSFLEALRRSGRIPGFADGGKVGAIPSFADGGEVGSMMAANLNAFIASALAFAASMRDVSNQLQDELRAEQALFHALAAQLRGGFSGAGGGLLGGRGSGTSDSNLAWVSRGEYITPARAVAQPGVLAFLEALRQSGGNLSRVLDGMGRFALGGMVRGPMPAFAGGGLAGSMSNVTIQFPGLPAIGGLRASADVVDQLHRAAALAQVRSGGRKPSRYS